MNSVFESTGISMLFVLATLTACGGGGGGSGGSSTPLAGSLDTSFGTGGIVTTPFGSSHDAKAIALQSDGKIVVAGYSYNGANTDIALARYNANGSLDTSFGTGGIVTTPVGASAEAANAIALQSDGKIVVAGYSHSGLNADIALVRYNANGSLDTSFGTGGIVTTPVGTSSEVANAIALQSDGKIVVAGFIYDGANYTIALARYNANGSLDTTFDGDGIVTTPVGIGDDFANAIALQSDGKIVVAGSISGATEDFALARYNANGSLDTSFGTGGIVTTPVGGNRDGANAIALQSDGKIVVAGYSYSGAKYDIALARYNANGSLDTTFDGDGIVTTPVGISEDIANAIALQSDGKIVVAGRSSDSGDNIALARYNANGSLDTTFDGDGIVTTPVGIGTDDVANAIALQSDGKIVVAGSSDNGNIVLARYQP